MPFQESVQDDGDADQGQGNEGQADARATEILGESRADLRAHRAPGVHDQGDKDIDVQAARNAGVIPIQIDGARSIADAVNEILALT